MVEDTENIVSLLKDSRRRENIGLGKETEDAIRHACTFLNGCRVGKPVLSFFIQEEAGYTMYPVIKFKLKFSICDQSGKKIKDMVKTIHPGMGRSKISVFCEMLEYYRMNPYDIDLTFKEIALLLGRPCYEEFDAHIDRQLKGYMQSSEFNRDYNSLKRKRAEKLRRRVEAEILQKFHVLLSIGTDEEAICAMFRQAEVERVIGC